MSKLTADTITDEQIRELQSGVTSADDTWWHCHLALNGGTWSAPSPRSDARARCAEILNARKGGNNV